MPVPGVLYASSNPDYLDSSDGMLESFVMNEIFMNEISTIQICLNISTVDDLKETQNFVNALEAVRLVSSFFRLIKRLLPNFVMC